MLNLKCEGANLWDNYQHQARWRCVAKYLTGKMNYPDRGCSNVLDIGCENIFGKRLVEIYKLDYYNTVGDLDGYWGIVYGRWESARENFDNVFCFDVLEHLMNPLLFLEKLKNYVDKDTKIFIGYPYRKFDFLWGNCHFHEFRPEAFETLIYSAGYKIVDHQKFRIWKKWTANFGFRPILRLIVVLLGWAVNNIYLVQLEEKV